MRCLILIVFICTTCSVVAQDTFRVYFSLNNAKIDKQSTRQIDDLIFKDKLVHGQKLVVLGYADYIGDNKYNDVLSRSRAEHVRDYLTAMGLDKNDIELCIGKGKIARAITNKEGHSADRHVAIIIDRRPKADIKVKKDSVAKITTKPILPHRELLLFDPERLKVNDVVPLDHVLFAMASDVLDESSYLELDKLVAFLRANTTVTVRIEGHICCGSWGGRPDTGIESLSSKRAYAVYKVLVHNAIDEHRLSYKGLSTTDPYVIPEKSAADEALNRRVGIRITSK